MTVTIAIVFHISCHLGLLYMTILIVTTHALDEILAMGHSRTTYIAVCRSIVLLKLYGVLSNAISPSVNVTDSFDHRSQ